MANDGMGNGMEIMYKVITYSVVSIHFEKSFFSGSKCRNHNSSPNDTDGQEEEQVEEVEEVDDDKLEFWTWTNDPDSVSN